MSRVPVPPPAEQAAVLAAIADERESVVAALAEVNERLDAAIVDAVAAGGSERETAALARVSTARVHRVLRPKA